MSCSLGLRAQLSTRPVLIVDTGPFVAVADVEEACDELLDTDPGPLVTTALPPGTSGCPAPAQAG